MNTSLSERKEVYEIVKSLVPETAIDFTRILPRIISLYIFSFLDPRSLCRAAQVSCYWKILSESNSIWASKCLLLGWQLPNVISQPEPGAYKQLYVENMINLRLVSSTLARSELRKLRKRMALDEQRVAEFGKKQAERQGTLHECKQMHSSPQRHEALGAQRFVQNNQRTSTAPKSLEGLPSVSFLKEPRMSSKRSTKRIPSHNPNNRAKIATVAERLSVPLERQKSSIIHRPPTLATIRNGDLHQQKPTKPLKYTSSTIIDAFYGQGFVPLSPKAIRALPPPPPYKAEKVKGRLKEMRSLQRRNEIFEIIKDVPT